MFEAPALELFDPPVSGLSIGLPSPIEHIISARESGLFSLNHGSHHFGSTSLVFTLSSPPLHLDAFLFSDKVVWSLLARFLSRPGRIKSTNNKRGSRAKPYLHSTSKVRPVKDNSSLFSSSILPICSYPYDTVKSLETKLAWPSMRRRTSIIQFCQGQGTIDAGIACRGVDNPEAREKSKSEHTLFIPHHQFPITFASWQVLVHEVYTR